MNLIVKVFVFIFGSFIGSFLNVYIYRTCKNEEQNTKESVFFPKRYYCPNYYECIDAILSKLWKNYSMV